MGVYGYALQIYCDFSGYSDMAIGIALLLGFHFNINFDSLISPLPLRNFGGGGIFRFPAGCAITFIFLWEATGRGKSANMPISSLPCSWAACGMALRGILYFGE